jgi:hypothetical protein
MLSLQTALPWLTHARSWFSEVGAPKREVRDAIACFCDENPGTVPLGRVLYHTTAFDGVRTAEMMDCCYALVLMDRDGTVLTRIDWQRIRAVECASASADACRERNPLQSEEHLFIDFDDDQGERSRLELSFGALDDVGPVHLMCEHLRARLAAASQ